MSYTAKWRPFCLPQFLRFRAATFRFVLRGSSRAGTSRCLLRASSREAGFWPKLLRGSFRAGTLY